MKRIRLTEVQLNRLVNQCVKQTLNLNESEMNNANKGYQIVDIEVIAVKDDYKEGCTGPETAMSINAPQYVFKTLKELVDYVKNKCLYNDEVDAYAWEDSVILFSYLADSNGRQLSERAIEDWQRGENDNVYAYDAHVSIRKVAIEDVSIDEMRQNGLQEY